MESQFDTEKKLLYPPCCHLIPQTIQTASGNASIRTLVCGDIEGQFSSFATNLGIVEQRQGPFSFAVCCGNFFGDGDVLQPSIIKSFENRSLSPDNDQLTEKCQSCTSPTPSSNVPQTSSNVISGLPDCQPSTESISPTTLKPDSTLEDKDFISGSAQFPLPVFFIDCSSSPMGEYLRREYPTGVHLTQSLEYLGGFGLKRICSLNVGILSGRYDPSVFFDEAEDEESIELPEIGSIDVESSRGSPETTQVNWTQLSGDSTHASDAAGPELANGKKYFGGRSSSFYCRSMLQRFKDIGSPYIGKTDLFISCEWPVGTEETLNSEQKQQLTSLLDFANQENFPFPTSPVVSELVEMLEPRFHLAAGCGVFYQRPIYRTSEKGLTSRFIGLGRLSSATKVSSEKRLKFLHALILKPMSDLPTQSLLATPSTTPSPYFSLYNPRSSTALFPTPLAFPHFESPSRYKRARPLDLGFSHLDGLSQTPPGTSTGCVPSDPSSPYESKRQRISDPTVPSTTTPASSPFAVIHNLLSNRNIGPVPPRPPPRPTDEQQEIHTNSVFITNIPYEVDSESFTDVMKSFGTVISHNFPRTPDGMSTGRAWITYENVNSAEQAVAASDQLESGGRLLKIQFTHSQHSSRKRFEDDNNGRFNGRNGGRQQLQQRRTSQAIDVRPHSDCWFCLANPNCEKRLIVAIGEKVYVALAKGGIVHQHVLIIPVTHFPNFVFCPPDVALELEKYIVALRNCYRNQGMGAVIYERYFPMKATTGMHMQLQVVPVPNKCASRSLEVFQSRAERLGVTLHLMAQGETISTLRRRVVDPIHQAYFYVEMPGIRPEQVERCLYVTSADGGQHQRAALPLNFGREAIAALMDIPQRSDWKRCVESESVEMQLAQQMQKLFGPCQPK